MKFKSYLNESMGENIFDILDKIKKECGPYIKDVKASNKILLSGRNRAKMLFDKKRIRKDRNPLSTRQYQHDFYDMVFKKKFGVKLRSESMFCSLSYNTVTGYGRAYYVFPIGNYDIYYSNKVFDLFGIPFIGQTKPVDYFNDAYFLTQTWSSLLPILVGDGLYKIKDLYKNGNFSDSNDYKQFEKEWIEKIKKGLEFAFGETVDTYKTGSMSGINKMGIEVMLVSDYVYLLNKTITDDLLIKDYGRDDTLLKYIKSEM